MRIPFTGATTIPLLPCPFCGAEAKWYELHDYSKRPRVTLRTGDFRIRCVNPECPILPYTYRYTGLGGGTEEQIAGEWNERSISDDGREIQSRALIAVDAVVQEFRRILSADASAEYALLHVQLALRKLEKKFGKNVMPPEINEI